MGVPMSYLIRKKAEALNPRDLEDDDPLFDDIDSLLIRTVELTGPAFKRHNQLLFDNLKVLTSGGDCWQFIQHLRGQNNRNGREAFFLLKRQAEGDEARKTRVKHARDLIRNTVYTGNRKFPFHKFVTTHVKAHNILLQEVDDKGKSREPPEDDKVQDFLDGIRDTRLDAAKQFVQGGNLKHDFTGAQQYLTNIVSSVVRESKNNARSERSIGGLESSKKRKWENPKKKKGKGNKRVENDKKNPKKYSGGKIGSGIYFGNMEYEEWSSKSESEQEKIRSLRQAQSGGNSPNKKARVGSVEQQQQTVASVENLVSGGATNGEINIGGKSVKFVVSATATAPATTSTPAKAASSPKSGTDNKEEWLSEDYKAARDKSASAQFGSKSGKKRAQLQQLSGLDPRKPAAKPAADASKQKKKKPAALETAGVSRGISSVASVVVKTEPVSMAAAAYDPDDPKNIPGGVIDLTVDTEDDYMSEDDEREESPSELKHWKEWKVPENPDSADAEDMAVTLKGTEEEGQKFHTAEEAHRQSIRIVELMAQNDKIAKENIATHPDLKAWKNRGMKWWSINHRYKALSTEHEFRKEYAEQGLAPDPNDPDKGYEEELKALSSYIKSVTRKAANSSDKESVLDLFAYNLAKGGDSYISINTQVEQMAERFDNGEFDDLANEEEFGVPGDKPPSKPQLRIAGEGDSDSEFEFDDQL